MGIVLLIICVLFFVYGLFGEYLLGDLVYCGYGFDQIVNQLLFGIEGFYGMLIYVLVIYIYLFILFGVFFEQVGMICLFIDFVMGLFGYWVGGLVKVLVFFLVLMGIIIGFGVVNVVIIGQFIILLMKCFGYKLVFVGGVEVIVSMGS